MNNRPRPTLPDSLQGPLLIALGAVVYAGTLLCDFAFDDVLWVVDNPLIRSLRNLAQFFASGQLGQRVYRPLALVSFALDYSLAGLRPWFYHADNAVLHGLIAFLVYRLLRPFGRQAAWLAAALFAVLPVHVDVVANVTARNELLATLLALLALLQLERPLLAGGLLLLALMAKETAVVVPGLAVLLWWRWPDRPPVRRMAATLLTLGAAVGAYLLIRPLANCCVLFPGDPLYYQTDNPLLLADWSTRLKTALTLPGQNLAACLLPVPLSGGSPPALLVTRWTDPRMLLWLLLPLAGLGACLAFHRSHPNLARGLAWFLVAVFPICNIVLLIGVFRADRLLYLSSVGVCLVAGELLSIVLAGARWPAMVLTAVLLFGLGAVAAARSLDWRTQESIARAYVRISPHSAEAHQLLASYLRQSGDCNAAIPVYRRALELFPQYVHAQVGLGACLEQERHPAAAVPFYAAASAAMPAEQPLAVALARACTAIQDWRCVASALQRQIAADPRPANQEIWTALGAAFFRAGQPREAEAAFLRALQLGNSPVAHFDMAGLLASSHRAAEAIEHYRAAEQAGMHREELYVDFAQALKRQGRSAAAREVAARGLALFPASPELRKVSREMGRR